MKKEETTFEHIDKVTTLIEELEAIDSSIYEEDKAITLLSSFT